MKNDQARWEYIGQLKEKGLTNSQIALKLDISKDRVRQLLVKHSKHVKHNEGWASGLTKITAFLLERNNIKSRLRLLASFQSGQLMQIARVGPATYNEIAKWLDKPEKDIVKLPPDYSVSSAIKFLNRYGYDISKRK